ncbi:hypothetical protein LJC17_03625 [Acholeplasma sp. OttesenSCG-928-E16]|nr:hypothetical protein [Acholeplasma sp. OttesenSCG-928-E16]
MNICVLSSLLQENINDPFLKKIEKELKPNFIYPKEYQGDDVIFYIQTGGTEGVFLKLFDLIPKNKEIILISSKENNSLAASMEIASFLKANNISCRIIHGNLDELIKPSIKLGVIGKPSDWLISSSLDKNNLFNKHHIELIDIELDELYDIINNKVSYNLDSSEINFLKNATLDENEIEVALNIYGALKVLVDKYQLMGFTIRCFDLIGIYKNTGCLALSLFNKNGCIATCEGDLKTLITMYFCQKILGEPGFQANPSSINDDPLSITFAHCTIPIQMLDSYKIVTHFESGIGVAIKGVIKAGPITLLKVDLDSNEYVCFEAKRIDLPYNNNLCRTQISFLINNEIKDYFLRKPLGNHHVITLGKNKELLDSKLQEYGFMNVLK